MTCRCVPEEKAVHPASGLLEMKYKLFAALQEVLVESGTAEPPVRKIARETLLIYLDLGEVWVPSGAEAWELKPEHPAASAVAGRLTRSMHQLLQAVDQAGTEEILALRRKLRL